MCLKGPQASRRSSSSHLGSYCAEVIQELTPSTLWAELSSPFGGCSGISPLILGCGLEVGGGGVSLWEGSWSASGVDL